MPLIRTGRNVRFQPQRAADTSEQFSAFINLQETVQGIAGGVSNTLFEARGAESAKKANEDAQVDAASQTTNNRIVVDGEDNPIDVVEPQLRTGSLDRFLGPSVSQQAYNQQAQALYLEQKRVVQEGEIGRLALKHSRDPDAFLDAAESYRLSMVENSLPALSGTLNVGLQGSIVSTHAKLRANQVTHQRARAQAVSLNAIEVSANALDDAARSLSADDPAFIAKAQEYRQTVGLAFDQGFIKDMGPYLKKGQQIYIAGGLKRELGRQGFTPEFISSVRDGNMKFPMLVEGEDGKLATDMVPLKSITTAQEREEISASLTKLRTWRETNLKAIKSIRVDKIKSAVSRRLIDFVENGWAGVNGYFPAEEVTSMIQAGMDALGDDAFKLMPLLTASRKAMRENSSNTIQRVIADQFEKDVDNNPDLMAQLQNLGVDDEYTDMKNALNNGGASMVERNHLYASLSRLIGTEKKSSNVDAEYDDQMAELDFARHREMTEFVRKNLTDDLPDDLRDEKTNDLIRRYKLSNSGRVLTPDVDKEAHKRFEERRLKDYTFGKEPSVESADGVANYMMNARTYGRLPKSVIGFLNEAVVSENVEKLDAALKIWRAGQNNPQLKPFMANSKNLGENLTGAYEYLNARWNDGNVADEHMRVFRNLVSGKSENLDLPPHLNSDEKIWKALFGKKSSPLYDNAHGDKRNLWVLKENSYMPTEMMREAIALAKVKIPRMQQTQSNTDFIKQLGEEVLAELSSTWRDTKYSYHPNRLNTDVADLRVFSRNPPETLLELLTGEEGEATPSGDRMMREAVGEALKFSGLDQKQINRMVKSLGQTKGIMLSREPVNSEVMENGRRLPMYQIMIPDFIDNDPKKDVKTYVGMRDEEAQLPLYLNINHFRAAMDTKKGKKLTKQDLIAQQEEKKAEPSWFDKKLEQLGDFF